MSLYEIAMTLLQPAINCGLSESDFWNMTKIEVERYLEGATWRMKVQAQFYYSLADLIGVSCARIMSKDVEFPTIEQVYPNLYLEPTSGQEEEVIEEQKDMTASVNRFLEFAMAHNSKIRKELGNESYDN